MRCLFCKQDSSNSKSVEHIIPESLGNIEHLLPVGIVCDKCNNYFSHEVEAPILNSIYFTEVRYKNFIENKKRKIPLVYGFYLQGRCEIGFHKDAKTLGSSIFPRHEKDAEKFAKALRSNKQGTLIRIVPNKPSEYEMSRFLGKIALEALASKVIDVTGGLDEIIDKTELDDLRDFVRRGNFQRNPWQFYEREIYSEDKMFCDERDGNYQLLHEYTVFYTEDRNLFFTIALFGTEYTIDMGQPEITEFKNWLIKNQDKSPLYLEK